MLRDNLPLEKLNKLEIIVKFKVSEVKLNGIMQEMVKEVNPVVVEKEPRGRKLKYTDGQRSMVINSNTKSVAELGRLLGVSAQSIYKYRVLWMKNYPHLVKGSTKRKEYTKRKKRDRNITFKQQKGASTDYKVESADE